MGASAEDGRWIEDALRPTGLDVRRRGLRSGNGPSAREPAAPAVVVLHERRRLEDLVDALEELRADPALGRVPLVVVDHERAVERFTAALARGAAACMCPPFDPAQLRATVARLARWRDAATGAERRLRRRRPLLLRVDLHLPGEGRARAALLRDVSASGCRLEAEEAVPAGTEVAITPYGYNVSLEFRVGARVWRTVEVGPALHMLACRFVGTGAVMAPRLFAVRPPRPARQP